MGHVSILFEFYNEENSFLDEYLKSIFSHEINLTLACFRDLIDKIDDSYIKKWRKNDKLKEKTYWIGESKLQSDDRLRKN